MGDVTTASGESSTAMGMQTTAFGESSTAMGLQTRAIGNYSTAMGSNATANGYYSTAMGLGTFTNIYGGVVFGRYNVIAPGNPETPNSNDRVFQVGDGISANLNDRKDIMYLTRGGNLIITGSLIASGVLYPSDIRLKTAIAPLQDVLSNIDKIQPIMYYFKDKNNYPSTHQIGFSAQEIAQEFPELVNKTDNGYLSVNYPQMTAVAIQAIKEQQEIIKKQEEKITNQEKINDVLNAKNADLEKRIEKLEKMMLNK
jgi:hypothetical protein